MTIHHDNEHNPNQTPEIDLESQAHKSETTPDFKEQFLRVSADFANYKRRIEKERLEWMQTAQAGVIQKMLPIMDDLERALAHTQNQSHQEQSSLAEGFTLIQKNVKKTFDDLGVQEINATGAFDPEFHEALVSIQATDKESGDIVDILRKGYMHRGKVLRHAQVAVAK